LTTEPKNSVRWDAQNVKAYAETARGDADPDIGYGWGFGLHGDVARWRECVRPAECAGVERERPAKEVLAIEHVGQGVLSDGTKVDVVKLSLTPRRKYVVPSNTYVPAR
jgi:hypothetical protein